MAYDALIIQSICVAHVHFILNVTAHNWLYGSTLSSSFDKILCRRGLKYFRAIEGTVSNLSARSSSLLLVVVLVLPKNDWDVRKPVLQRPDAVPFSFFDSVCRIVRTSLVSGKPWMKLLNKPFQPSWWCFQPHVSVNYGLQKKIQSSQVDFFHFLMTNIKYSRRL